MISRGVDVLVCGGGMAGLCAGVSAAREGASVLLVEKGPRLGGSFAMSGGLLWTWMTPPWTHVQQPIGDVLLQDRIVSSFFEDADWLGSLGVEMGGPRDMIDGHGWEIDPGQSIAVMSNEISSAGGKILTNTAMSSLHLTPGGDWQTNLATDCTEVVTAESKSVILATGGFQGNPELVSRYVGDPSHLTLRANRWSTGDGLTAGLALGALATRDLSYFYGHSLPAPPAAIGETHFRPASQYFGHIGIALNTAGERLRVPSESQGSEELVNRVVAAQPGGIAAYILDASLIKESAVPIGVPSIAVLLENAKSYGGTVLESDTIDGLCEQLDQFGFDGGQSTKTVHEYNNSLAAKAGAGDAASASLRRPSTISDPPFVAVIVKSAITFTCGGMAVTEQMEVLSRFRSPSPMSYELENGEAIPNLYAVGADVGGASSDGYLGGLATALVTGRRAGQLAARRSSR